MRYWMLMVIPSILVILSIGCSNGSQPGTLPDGQPEVTADDYLGGGYPIKGINYSRNNRSTYKLPMAFEFWDVYRDVFDSDDFYHERSFHDLAVDGNGKLYMSLMDDAGQGFENGSWKQVNYMLFAFEFGQDPGTPVDGGYNIALSENGLYSVNRYFYSSTGSGFGSVSSSSKYVSNITRVLSWPECAYEISTGWGTSTWFFSMGNSGSSKNGDWDGRNFNSVLPMPDDTLLITYAEPNTNPADDNHVQRLDLSLQVICEASLPDDIIGLSFDEDTNHIYLTTADRLVPPTSGLYCFNENFELQWDTSKHWNNFSSELPVIDNDGGILGVYDGKLKRVNSNGEPDDVLDCGARTRPALFNDGAFVVVCDTGIKLFNTSLTEIASFPLPTWAADGYLTPLVDSLDNFAIAAGTMLYIYNRDGEVLIHRNFEKDIRAIRLGPENLFVALDDALYRFPVF